MVQLALESAVSVPAKPLKLVVVYCINSSKKTKMEILAIIATNVVTIVGMASYTSGLQK